MPELPILPAIADQPLSVVLLAHEATHLDGLLPAWTSYLDRLGRPWEIVVAETASGATGEKMERYLRNPRITLIRREGPPAEGLALTQALQRCQHPLVFTAPLAPRYGPGELAKFLIDTRARRLDNDAPCPEIDLVHLATGYRTGQPVPPAWQGLGLVARTLQGLVLGLQPTPLPGWLGLRAHLANLLYRVLFGVRNRDAACPCRLLRREIVPRLALQSEGPFVHVEILAKATFLGLILSEDIPLTPARDSKPEPTVETIESRAQRSRDFRRLFWNARFGREAGKSPEPASTP